MKITAIKIYQYDSAIKGEPYRMSNTVMTKFDTTIVELPGNRPMVVSDAYGEAMTAAGEAFELEGGMLRVCQPEAVVFLRQLLNVLGQCMKQLPEARRGGGFHARAGQFLVSPA